MTAVSQLGKIFMYTGRLIRLDTNIFLINKGLSKNKSLTELNFTHNMH